ncbi:hypothetical protein [Shewanella algicola]|uniref:hypothetical protein n=1 Tax=Shewanella algicola TaxID=640633 RepID=UPI0024945943|nr:hypothetical protein [Shewanella algicola]
MQSTCHFTAEIKGFLGTSRLELLSRAGEYFICQHNENFNKILLNGCQSLRTAISMIATVTSDPFVTVNVIKQLDIELPSVTKKQSFSKPESTECIVVGVHQRSFTLAIAVHDKTDLSKATVINGEFSTTLSDIRLFDEVSADLEHRIIRFKS